MKKISAIASRYQLSNLSTWQRAEVERAMLAAYRAGQAENAELRKAQAEVIERIERVMNAMKRLSRGYADSYDVIEVNRLDTKIEGMEVVLSYIKEMMKP